MGIVKTYFKGKKKPKKRKPLTQKKLQHAVLERDHNTCVCCDANTIAPPHHITHKSQGGEDEMSNMVTMCSKCHDLWHKKGVRWLLPAIQENWGDGDVVRFFVMGVAQHRTKQL